MMQYLKPIIAVSLSIVVFGSCQKKVYHLSDYNRYSHRFDEKIKDRDPKIDSIIKPYKEKMDKETNVVIGTVDKELIKSRPWSTLTNLCADAIREEYESKSGKSIDAVFINFGGVRLPSLGAGEITVGEIFEIMPFDNEFLVVQLDSATLHSFVIKMAKSGGWPISSGSGYAIQDSMPQQIIINQKPLTNARKYAIGLPDYIANGGDGMSIFTKVTREETKLLMRNMMIDYIKRNKQIKANFDERIKLIK